MAGCGRIDEAIGHYQRALEIKPDYIDVLNNLAWLRATYPEAVFRNATAAVELAERANRLSGGKAAEILDTLSAAYAEAGRFSQAQETIRRVRLGPATEERGPAENLGGPAAALRQQELPIASRNGNPRIDLTSVNTPDTRGSDRSFWAFFAR